VDRPTACSTEEECEDQHETKSNKEFRFDQRPALCVLILRLVPGKVYQSQMSNTTKNIFDELGNYTQTSGIEPSTSTTIVRDDADTSSVTAGVDRLRLPIINSVTVTGSQRLHDFFRKPTRLTTGNLTTTDATRIPAAPIEVDKVLIGTAQKQSKFSGNLLWRGDIVLRLQVNATRFQSGRYLLAWFPTCGSNFTDASVQAFYRMHSCNLMQISQLPHAEIDIAKQTSVELRIPFTSIYPFHTVKSTGSDMGLGAAFIFPYAKLAGGSGNTTAPFVLWGHFENIVLSGPTVTQSGIGGSSNAGIEVRSALPSEKKRQNENVSRYNRINVPYPANVDTRSASTTLGMLSTTNIAQSVGQGDGTQETGIDFIKKRPAYLTTFNWPATSATDTNLLSYGHNVLYTSSYGKGTTYTPVAFLGTMFKLWRGSMIFKFKMAKNEFYSGRLVVMYQPSYRVATFNALQAGKQEYAFREIIDIRDSSEFEVVLPYISPELWTATTDTVGWLSIDVLDPLLAPNTVDQNIAVIVEVVGGDDLEFQYPVAKDHRPWAPITVQSGKLEETETPRVDFGVPTSTIPDVVHAASIGEKVPDLKSLIVRFCANPGPKLVATSTQAAPQFIFPFLLNITSQNSVAPNALFKDAYKTDLFSRLTLCYAMNSGGVRLVLEPWEVDTDDVMELGMDYDQLIVPTTVVGFFTYTMNPNALRVPVSTRVDGLYDVIIPAYSRTLARSTAVHLICSTDTTFKPTLAKQSKMTFLSVQNLTATDVSARAYNYHRMAADDFNLHLWLGTIPMVDESAT